MRFKTNTVHLMILMALRMSILGRGLTCRGRSGKLLILRLTPRKLRWLRLETTRFWSISSRTALWKALFCRGGNSAIDTHFAADHAHGVEKREPVGVFAGFESGFVHQAADGEVSHHQAVELLTHQIGGFAAQHDLGSAEVGLEFIERGVDLPALVIKGSQFPGRSLGGIEDGGRQAIDRLRALDTLQAIVDHPQDLSVAFVPPVSLRRIHVAQIGTIRQALLAGHAHVLFHPPEQIGACCLPQLPQFEAKEISVSQTKHATAQARKHRFGQRDLACPVTIYLAAKQHVCAVLHQGYETDLRIRAGTAAGPWARESIFVGLLVGDIEGAAVLPSRLTRRQLRYHAPRVLRTATGFTKS